MRRRRGPRGTHRVELACSAWPGRRASGSCRARTSSLTSVPPGRLDRNNAKRRPPKRPGRPAELRLRHRRQSTAPRTGPAQADACPRPARGPWRQRPWHPSTPPGPSQRPALPRVFLVWLVGTRASLFGDAVLYFALGWAASAHGGGTGALVLTAITLPRTLLLLLGGAVGDRFGARLVMITGDVVMLTVTLVLALVGPDSGASPWLLVLVAVVIAQEAALV
nr:MFS transporter [Streptomyces sp. Sge12]